MASCQKENVDAQRLELVAEGMGGNQKTYVDGVHTYWMDGDLVSINGTTYTVSADGSAASISGSFNSGTTYVGVFPAGIMTGHSGSTVNLSLPGTYTYREDGSGHHVLDAPMAAYGTPSDGKLFFNHLTAALEVQVKNEATAYAIVLDSIVVSSDADQLCGPMTVDLTDLATGTRAMPGTGSTRQVVMLFDGSVTVGYNNTKTIQVPIRAASGQNFTIRVVGHYQATRYIFERSQTGDDNVIGRAQLGYAKALMRDGETGFSTEDRLRAVGTDTYGIYNLNDLKAFYEIHHVGSYPNKTFKLMADIDASGYSVAPISNFNNGTLDGNGHTIANLTVIDNTEGEPALIKYNCHATVVNLTLRDITLSTTASGTIYAGAFFPNMQMNSNYTLSNCHVDGMTVNAPNAGSTCYIGGLIGMCSYSSSYELTLTGCSFSGTFTFHSDQNVDFGGLVGNYSGLGATHHAITNCTVNTNATISSSARLYAGGLVGEMEYSMILTGTNNTVSGTLDATGNASSDAGGYVGYNPNQGDGIHWVDGGGNSTTLSVTTHFGSK
ncbi:MAG: hypothetical protein IJ524_04430 [Bacteroidales bacterium]|nr:hypothetical protein [Bacteroidales bacterium]